MSFVPEAKYVEAQAPMEPKPMEAAHVAVISRLDDLDKIVEVLIHRLDPVSGLGNPEPGEEKLTEVDQRSDLVRQVSSYGERVRAVNERLHRTIDRLEI